MKSRGMTLKEAADYCGVSPSTFRSWEQKGLLSCRWQGTNRYDKRALDRDLDRMSGLANEAEKSQDAFATWLGGRRAREAKAHQECQDASR